MDDIADNIEEVDYDLEDVYNYLEDENDDIEEADDYKDVDDSIADVYDDVEDVGDDLTDVDDDLEDENDINYDLCCFRIRSDIDAHLKFNAAGKDLLENGQRFWRRYIFQMFRLFYPLLR